MAAPEEILGLKRIIKQQASQVKDKENITKHIVNNMTSWWEGCAADTFIEKYSLVASKMKEIYSESSKLEQDLNELSSNVAKAIAEREAAKKRAMKSK